MKNLIIAIAILFSTSSFCQDFMASNDETNPVWSSQNTVKIDNVYFESNHSNLNNDSKNSLNVLLKVLIENPEMNICINSFSQKNENKNVSAKRALEVKKYFVKNGVSSKRLSTKCNENSKLISEIDAEKINRRVEFILE